MLCYCVVSENTLRHPRLRPPNPRNRPDCILSLLSLLVLLQNTHRRDRNVGTAKIASDLLLSDRPRERTLWPDRVARREQGSSCQIFCQDHVCSRLLIIQTVCISPFSPTCRGNMPFTEPVKSCGPIIKWRKSFCRFGNAFTLKKYMT